MQAEHVAFANINAIGIHDLLKTIHINGCTGITKMTPGVDHDPAGLDAGCCHIVDTECPGAAVIGTVNILSGTIPIVIQGFGDTILVGIELSPDMGQAVPLG